MPSSIVLEVSHLSKAYDNTRLLSDISFCLHSGEMLSIIGQNSSFKTTLAHILCGLAPYDSGTVLLDGEEACIFSPYEAHRSGIILLGEIAQLCDDLTVAENIFLFSRQKPAAAQSKYGWQSSRAVLASAARLLREYDFDFLKPGDPVGSLGLAEKQMLAFLCAVTQNARVLIIDDAFSALSAEERKKIYRILEQIKQKGTAILYLSSRVDVPQLVDSVLVIEDGTIRLRASGEQLRGADFSKFPFITPPRPYPKLPVRRGAEVFRCEHISYRDLLTDISLCLHEGEILGIAGGAGVGKTTLARLIAGHIPHSAGAIYIDGRPVHFSSVYDAYQNGLRLILDDREYGIIRHLSLAENLIFPYYGPVRFPFFPISPRRYTDTSYCLASRLDIDYFDIGQPPDRLSAGNQQKLILSRGIVAGANIFILDEPTRGVDHIGRMQIYNMFNNLLRDGKSIIILTSDRNEAAGMCDRVLFLEHGSLKEMPDDGSL